MKIFPEEIKDGIAELVQASASIAYCSPAVINDDVSDNMSTFAETIKASSANPKQIDLYYLKSVLVSTGWNKNDDVFPNEATYAARNTPEDKQFNFMHDENDIIGHITGSYVVDREGNVVNDDDNQPKDFDIITEAVLYNSWTDPENRMRMNQIIAEIQEGKWFVSMECLFAGFDYALLDVEGNAKLLERNEGSAFLTKHLRAYGGTGEYEGYKVGRSLRDISFSGKGLVSKPANPRSIILDSSRAFSYDNSVLFTYPTGDNLMSDTNLLEKQLTDLKSELASAKEENQALRVQIDESASKEQSESIAKLEEALTEKEEAIKALEVSVAEKETSITELQDSIAKSGEDMKEKMEELKKMKKEKKSEARKASLIEAGLDASEAEESLASYDEFSDEAFDLVISAMYKMKKKMDDKKEEENKGKAEEAPAEEVAEAAEVTEESVEEATEELFEGVASEEPTLVDASSDTEELETTRASVAQWLENNVLNK